MAIHLNQDSIPAETLAAGVRRQALLDPSRVPGLRFRLDRLALDAGVRHRLSVGPGDVAWFQMLEGAITLRHGEAEALTDAHVVFLPPGFDGTLETATGGALLLAVIPDAAQLDAGFAASPPGFRIVDWKHEPLLGSQHDARRRIYLATPKLFGTRALKGEMIIYPPRTEAPNHHHEGAAHFMYFLKGGGTCYASEQPFTVRAGDIVYYDDRERHYLRGADDTEMVFSEFFVPGEFKTVWVQPNKACTWLPTGKNFLGSKASREIAAHSMAHGPAPTDV